MYGTGVNAAGGGGATLAYTGVATGSWMLAAFGLVCAGLALIALARRRKKGAPRP